jgi:deoxyribodipyrimidine photo-lyase
MNEMAGSAKPPVLVWFRQDLRLGDNPALAAAVGTGAPVLPVYVLDAAVAGDWAPGAASRWWLHGSLQSLDAALDGKLCLLDGAAIRLIPDLICATGASDLYLNACVEPWWRELDAELELELARDGIGVGL